MKKNYLFAAAVLAMASCTSDDFLGGNVANEQPTSDAIMFAPTSGKTTRADHVGADAAELLNNNFVVEGVSGNGDYAGSLAQTEQFDHYNVKYTAGTANTTETNTHDWEYVGIGKHGLSASSSQTIKYWDFGAKQYDFIAFSYGKSDYTKADLTEMKYANLGNAVDATGNANAVYTVTGKAEELAKTYLANLVTLYNRNGVSEFKTTVTPKFRSMGTKVRVAFYETVPGYSVKNVKFYKKSWDGTTPTSEAGADEATLFASKKIFPGVKTEGTMSVYYPTVGWENSGKASTTLSPDYNQAHVKFEAGTGDKNLANGKSFGTLDYKAANEGSELSSEKYLGRSSSEATYAGNSADHYYQIVLPLGTSDNLQIRVEYDLVPTDGGAGIIHIRDARAVVPAAYAEWLPNYAYTYIFKISDNTNGWTGTDGDGNVVEGLTPITFDAVVVDSEDGNQETVTTVATPSITTYQEGVNATVTNEYRPGDIYVSVMNGTSPATLSLSPANYGIYKVTAGKDIINEAIATDMLNGIKSNTGITWEYTASQVVSEVPAVDGNTYSISAAKFTGEPDEVYVFDYVSDGKNYVKIIRVSTTVAAAAGYDWTTNANPYTYNAAITTSGNEVTFTYATGTYTAEKLLTDMARYLGAIYYAGGAKELTWNSNVYEWNPTAAGNLQGSNWWNSTSSKTMVKELKDYFTSTSDVTSITIQIDGVTTTINLVVNS